jgi:hypothetical protein
MKIDAALAARLSLICLLALGGCASNPGSGEILVSLSDEKIVLPGGVGHLAPLSGDEVRTALADHTAILPGGFIEYYAPDGKVHGWSDGQAYQGTWEIRKNMFCTALSGDPAVCSEVGREADTLYWSIDGQKIVSPVRTILAGNAKNLS